jgi:hypothetical protein
MWEHGMPGSAWSMAADLLRWEELRAQGDIAEHQAVDDREFITSRTPRGGWLRRRFENFGLTGSALRGS